MSHVNLNIETIASLDAVNHFQDEKSLAQRLEADISLDIFIYKGDIYTKSHDFVAQGVYINADTQMALTVERMKEGRRVFKMRECALAEVGYKKENTYFSKFTKEFRMQREVA